MTRSPLFNFGLGLFFGALAGAAGAAHVCANRAQRHAAEMVERIQDTQEHLAAVSALAEESLKRAVVAEARAQACEAGAGKLTADLQQRDFRDSWYTLVYEPGATTTSPLELLNLARPGLGTLLAKLQAQSAPPAGVRLRYVLHGYVEAEATPPGVHLVRTLTPPESAVQ
jgi:hypothetical protein